MISHAYILNWFVSSNSVLCQLLIKPQELKGGQERIFPFPNSKQDNTHKALYNVWLATIIIITTTRSSNSK